MAPHPFLNGYANDGVATRLDVAKFITGGWWIDDQHIVHGPKAVTQILPEALSQEVIRARSIINHSNAGTKTSGWRALFIYLTTLGVNIEPHFDVQLDGTAAQFVPLNRRADCNAKANAWSFGGSRYGAISFETQDNGSASLQTTPWALEQFETMVNIQTLICLCYRVRCTPCTTWDDSGIDYHSKFKEWSLYIKTCPGAARIRQMDELRHQVTEKVAAFYANCGGTCP